MFKRSTKITALLVAAASIMSLVPAMAADAKRLGTKEGTIEDAIAYKDGKYLFEGYRTDDNNKSVYFYDGSKDKELNDLTDARLRDGSKYDASKATAFENSDEYLVDLSNGKVTDEDVASDLKSTASDKLTAKLKKTDRYGSNVSVELERITANQFGDVWYSYTGTKQSVDSTGVRAIVTGTVTDSAISTSNIKILGTDFGVPAVATVPTFAPVKVNAQLAANGGKYAPVKIAGVEITSADSTYAQLQTAITSKASALAIAGYSVAISSETPEAGTVPANANITVTATKTGKISTAVGDYFRLNSADTFQVQVATQGTDEVKGYATRAELVSQINNAKYDNFKAEANDLGANNGIKVVLTQIAGKNYSAIPVGSTANFTASVTRDGSGTGVVSSGVYNGYTNQSGAYIDADKIANIRVFNGAKMVKLDEFDEDANDDRVKATVVNSTTIAQEKDYIYRIIDVKFTGSTGKLWNSKGGAIIFDSVAGIDNSHKYLQKISKAQGETDKDAYLPKSVETYELDATISGDAETAASKLATLVSDTDKVVGIRAIDGTLYYTEMDDEDTIKTYKLKLQKNEKVDTAVGKVDAYVVKKDGDKDHDLKGTAGKAGASFDVNGTLWIVNEGKISKSEKAGDFVDVYTVDRSMDSLDVYDENNVVAWDASGDVYTTTDEGKKVTQDEAVVVAPPAPVTGWVKGTDGTWTFNDVTGTKMTSKWINYQGSWYYLKADGIMATGWYNDNGTWYYLQSSGAMATGWLNDNGTWYYLNASGAMLANTTVDGYKLGANGAWVK